MFFLLIFVVDVFYVDGRIGFCGNSLSLILSDVWWDGIGQRGMVGTCGYWSVWHLDPVASVTMLLTETCTL